MRASEGSLLQHRAVHALGAFVAMGSWAVFANRAHPMPEPIVAGATQGALSALITLVLKRGIEAVAARLPSFAALVIPPVLCFVASVLLLWLVHTLAGTPEIASTIAVPVAVSTSYGAVYAMLLWRRNP